MSPNGAHYGRYDRRFFSIMVPSLQVQLPPKVLAGWIMILAGWIITLAMITEPSLATMHMPDMIHI